PTGSASTPAPTAPSRRGQAPQRSDRTRRRAHAPACAPPGGAGGPCAPNPRLRPSWCLLLGMKRVDGPSEVPVDLQPLATAALRVKLAGEHIATAQARAELELSVPGRRENFCRAGWRHMERVNEIHVHAVVQPLE